jgi:hypothetical protein
MGCSLSPDAFSAPRAIMSAALSRMLPELARGVKGWHISHGRRNLQYFEAK